jgi:hypothetical protein
MSKIRQPVAVFVSSKLTAAARPAFLKVARRWAQLGRDSTSVILSPVIS